MRKKFFAIVLLCLMCCNLTGCGLFDFAVLNSVWQSAEDAVSDAKEQQEDQKRTNLVTNITANSRSKDTENAMSKYKSAQQDVIDAENGWRGWPVIRSFPFIGANAKIAQADAAFEKLELAASTDAVYQDSLLNGVGDVTGTWEKFIARGGTVLIVVVIAIIAFLFIFSLLNKRRATKINNKVAKAEAKLAVKQAKAEVKAIEAQNAEPPKSIGVDNRKYNKTAISDEAYMRMIKENCARLGMDSQKLIADNGGNLELAYQQSNLAVATRKK